jgi:calcyclin binding protein
MVTVEEVENDPMIVDEEQDLPSQERLLDAISIEQAAASIDRPTARLHLQALAKKLRRESEALKRMEKNANMKESPPPSPQSSPTKPEPAAPPSSPPKPIAMTPSATNEASRHYTSIDRFSFDAGGYNAPFVTLYVPLVGVGKIPKENVKCNYTKSSFDLIVNDLNGKSYRLFKDNLEKDIDPDLCKLIIKSDEVRIKLHKVKQKDYGGYDYWTKLTESSDSKKKQTKEDPTSGIMDLMKKMYDEGDDNMKRMIGETMMKQRTGELNKDMGLDDKYKL